MAYLSNFSRPTLHGIIHSEFRSSPKDKRLISEIVMANARISPIKRLFIYLSHAFCRF